MFACIFLFAVHILFLYWNLENIHSPFVICKIVRLMSMIMSKKICNFRMVCEFQSMLNFPLFRKLMLSKLEVNSSPTKYKVTHSPPSKNVVQFYVWIMLNKPPYMVRRNVDLRHSNCSIYWPGTSIRKMIKTCLFET